MPKYLPSNDGSIVDTIPTPLPDPYGSRNDTRVIGVTQTHNNDKPFDQSTPKEIVSETFSVIPPNSVYDSSIIRRMFQYTIVIDEDSNVALPFKAQSIRFDNLSNHWFFALPMRIWIPPDFIGVILPVTGIDQITIIWQAPPGLLNPAATPNTITNIIAYFDTLPPCSGTRRL